jgi:hypothetical protein
MPLTDDSTNLSTILKFYVLNIVILTTHLLKFSFYNGGIINKQHVFWKIFSNKKIKSTFMKNFQTDAIKFLGT